MKLSILIPTLNEPESIRYLHRLRNILDPQVAKYPGEVEIRINDAGRAMPTGTKRNELIFNSDGDYFSQIDVDDIPAEYYVDEMMKGISMGVDVITFRGAMDTNGINRRQFVIRMRSEYVERGGVYYRWANHLCGFKRSKVEHIKFPALWEREDYIWSKEIHDRKLLQTEYFVDRHMYLYDFRTNKPAYGSARVRR
jgi:glycosyltransferase involved in cell wall biosynthesis